MSLHPSIRIEKQEHQHSYEIGVLFDENIAISLEGRQKEIDRVHTICYNFGITDHSQDICNLGIYSKFKINKDRFNKLKETDNQLCLEIYNLLIENGS